MPGVRQDVVVGVAAVHLRRDPAALAWQACGVGRLAVGSAVGQMTGVAKAPATAQRSRRTTAAANPIAPTMVSEPGASNGGPMTRL